MGMAHLTGIENTAFIGVLAGVKTNIRPPHLPPYFFFTTFWEKTMGVKYKLHSPKANRAVSIDLHYYYDGKRLKISTGQKIHPDYWDQRAGKPKKSYPACDSLKEILRKLEGAIESRYLQSINAGGYPTPEDLREAVLIASGKKIRDLKDLPFYVEQYAGKFDSIRTPYHRLKKKVDLYLEQTRQTGEVTGLSAAWFNRFQDWIIDNSEAEAYAHRQLKALKTAVRSIPENWPGKMEFLSAKIVASDQPGESIYLNWSEFITLDDVEIPNAHTDAARVLLLLHCLTGLRVSDWSKFDPEKSTLFAGFPFVRIVMKKTESNPKKQVAWVPVFRKTRDLYERWIKTGKPWDTDDDSDQTLIRNEIKEACRIAGFTELTEKIVRSRKVTRSETAPKYRRAMTKTARNTFVSNMRKTGISDSLLYQMTGHLSGRAAKMAETYDARKFEDVAPALRPYLAAFEKNIPSSGSIITWI